MSLDNIYFKADAGGRLSEDEALALAENGDILKLAGYADKKNRAQNKNRVAYLIDRNINYTNICKSTCLFCAFYRPKGHKEAYEISYEAIDKKIMDTLKKGGTRVLLQGGNHPDYTITDLENLVGHIHNHHKIHIHAFSPPEIHHAAQVSHLSISEVINRLMDRGLASIPGGGAEILVDKIRDRISMNKCTATQWLDVMQTAHTLGLKTTATMMMGHVERWPDRIEHLRKLRELQDKTQGFISFIPWTFQPENTALHPRLKNNEDVILSTPYDYLKLISIARLYLDNFKHIQASSLTQGIKTAQMALHYGADDIGSVMLEEHVVSLAGCSNTGHLTPEDLAGAIKKSGCVPYQRDSFYNEIS
ncbi:MAG: dehypoxanthine futalosine cyclase [Deltaproteobacteria bacterium]|nr:dehypoxanthine futalosine cyclase [Deltaproteobacteria bacterium]